ncbi:hypothetical protein MRX96_024086 [Rhipicephalus microplus]
MRLGVIFGVAVAVTLLSAVASFSILSLTEKSVARTVAYRNSPSLATSLPPVRPRMNATQELETSEHSMGNDYGQTDGNQQATTSIDSA